MHFYGGCVLLGLSWMPVYGEVANFICIFTVDPLCWGLSWSCVYKRVAHFVYIFTVDPLCFISEAISISKNAYIRKGGQFCMYFYGGSALLGLSRTPLYKRLAIFLFIFPGKGSGLGFSLSGGPLALYRRGVLTHCGGLNRRKNAVEMSLTSVCMHFYGGCALLGFLWDAC